jgi:microcystin-dependent protein
MPTGVVSWSKAAASNATADSNVNFAEGQAPSSLNDSARALMASVAMYRDDISGALTTSGSSTAYTLSTNQVFPSLAAMSGKLVAFVPHATNGATVTLNVDGLGAKPLRTAPSAELGAGVLVQGTPYVATYNNATSEWILQSFYFNPYNIPLGGLLPYTGATAPNSNFVLPYGQAISRATYASYFSLVGTTFGTGDGSTTFNVPDLRGRSIFGQDDMGGAAAGRVTNAGSGIVGTTRGATGGAENVPLVVGNIPQISGTTSSDGAHTHTHSVPNENNNPGVSNTGGVSEWWNDSLAGTATTSSNGAHTHSITLGTASPTAVNKMPPAMILPFILRIL